MLSNLKTNLNYAIFKTCGIVGPVSSLWAYCSLILSIPFLKARGFPWAEIFPGRYNNGVVAVLFFKVP